MCRDNATPTSPTTEGLTFLNKTLTVWEDIRSALTIVEELRKDPSYRNARVEVYQQNENKLSLKVTFRAVRELDEYLNSRFNRLLLEGIGDSLNIDDIERVSSEIYAQFNEMNSIHGHVIIE
jgi:ribosome maturation factor RimP